MNKRKYRKFARMFEVVADETRLRVLCMVFENRKLCVSELALSVGESVATTSHHLRTLSRVGILKATRKGKKVCYTPTPNRVARDLKRIICKYD